jgi:alpha-D-xyloside xylohydrolase
MTKPATRKSFATRLVAGATTVLMAGMMACVTATPAPGVQRTADGVVIATPAGATRLQAWSDRVIRVTCWPTGALPALGSLSVVGRPGKVAFQCHATSDEVALQTSAIRARVDRKTGLVEFDDLNGKPILREAPGREFAPTPAQGMPKAGAAVAAGVSDGFVLDPDEEIYGLGQHQNGRMSQRGLTVKLLQKNMDVGVPVLVSSKGYGVFWDNPAVTEIAVGVKGHEGVTRWTSEAGKAVDYYYLYGPNADGVVRDYRALTGQAPMMGKWLWGFWQCKERYASQKELLGVLAEYRKRQVPIDGIIQDWRYWKDGGWGSHAFDPARYPDPAAMVKAIHAMHAHAMISVWPKFDLGTPNFEELEKAGALYPPVIPSVYPIGQNKWYDAFNPNGRRIYWNQISRQLASLDFDAWWLDATEPELGGKWGEFRALPTAAGPGATVFNAYPLMTTTAVYRGQRSETDRKRVAILTRSAYAGQQRNAAITWSGDIRGDWRTFGRQIPAGLNFSISGIPYWNTDIGGFFGGKKAKDDPKYQELFTRWFQFGAFCPMFRVHGTNHAKEIWQWSEPTQEIWKQYVRLRYRLLPYIYSVSWQVTHEGGTMMRPLAMDFADDPKALNIGDQFLFGPALMACPVTKAGAASRDVYLPGKGEWRDFWTGKAAQGGTKIKADAPIQTMPIFVRPGSIVPMGPDVQYADEKPADPIELRVYRGADGAFTLYEDEGDNYDYEKGAYATIPIAWNEASQTLTVGARQGSFPGMLKNRTFRVVFVGDNHGAGVEPTAQANAVVRYSGEAATVNVPNLPMYTFKY